jgi:hypothetical protein
VATLPSVSVLEDKRNVSIVLRIVLDADGQVLHGEIVDVDGKILSRFAGVDGMMDMLQRWLDQQR